MSDTTECYERVAELVDELENMTEWENQFVMDVAEYEEKGRLFSHAQVLKIEELYERYCS